MTFKQTPLSRPTSIVLFHLHLAIITSVFVAILRVWCYNIPSSYWWILDLAVLTHTHTHTRSRSMIYPTAETRDVNPSTLDLLLEPSRASGLRTWLKRCIVRVVLNRSSPILAASDSEAWWLKVRGAGEDDKKCNRKTTSFLSGSEENGGVGQSAGSFRLPVRPPDYY